MPPAFVPMPFERRLGHRVVLPDCISMSQQASACGLPAVGVATQDSGAESPLSNTARLRCARCFTLQEHHTSNCSFAHVPRVILDGGVQWHCRTSCSQTFLRTSFAHVPLVPFHPFYFVVRRFDRTFSVSEMERVRARMIALEACLTP